MNKQKLIFGGIGALGILVFLVITIISLFGHGGYSVLNSFVSELGKYQSGYLSSSPALLFNIALVAGGLLTCVFFVGFGYDKRNPFYTAASFFGILTGVLVAAQGVFTLNLASVHYTFTVLLFISAFFTGALYIVASLTTQNIKETSLTTLVVAFAAASVSAVFAIFVQFGSMPDILSVPFEARLQFIPFAVVQWAAIALILGFAGLLSAKMLIGVFRQGSADFDGKPKVKLSLKKQSTRDLEL